MGTRDTDAPAAPTTPPIDHACDWPGCIGQCHTGSTCPCHPSTPAEALDVLAIRNEPDAAIEALRHLFWVMERLDRQAGKPFSHDHMVKITVETWLDIVRPAIEQVRAALSPHNREADT